MNSFKWNVPTLKESNVDVSTATKSKTITMDARYIPPARPGESANLYVARVAKYLRTRAGLTQKDVERISKGEFNSHYVSRLEAGKWSSIRKANDYLHGYGLNMDFNFDTKDDK